MVISRDTFTETLFRESLKKNNVMTALHCPHPSCNHPLNISIFFADIRTEYLFHNTT